MSGERSEGSGGEWAGGDRGRSELIAGLRDLANGRRGPSPRRDPASAPGAGDPVAAAAQGEERCELCGAPLPGDHRHLLELDQRRMLCACETCWSVRSGEAAFRPAGVRIVWLAGLDLPEDAWASFRIPIGLAFFMRAGDGRTVAFYPSPAGATESEIDAAAWERLVGLNPELAGLEPDCEALIVDRTSSEHHYAIAPIDECYRLVGMIKAGWEGISGGTGPERAIERFFAELRVRAATATGARG